MLLANALLATAQSVTISPTSVAFGDEAISTTSSAKTVTLKNASVALTISSIATTGDYAQTNTCGTSLAAGAKCTISVTFTPSVLGSDPGTLTIIDNASNSPQTVPLTGTGEVQAAVSPTSLSFGDQAEGTSSAAKTVTLTNNLGTALSISSIAASGAYSQTNTCGTSLAAGAKCTISVTFTPSVLGSDPGTLTIIDNASNSPQTVPLTGTGEVQAAVSPTSLSFGDQAEGTSSAAKTVTLTNNLGTALSISSIAASGAYSQTNTCGTSLAAGAKCTISVVFTPTTTGTLTGTLTIADSASNSPQTASLTGVGIVPVTVSPSNLSFGNQSVTTTSAAKTVTVTNKQPTAVSITSIIAPADYAQTNTCGTSLAAGATCTVSVTFSPGTTGSIPGTLTITDSASNSPQTVPLSGTGTALPTITKLSVTLGTVGTSVTITGTGFGGTQGSSTVTFNGVAATPISWKTTSIVAPVPASATTGSVVVTVNGGASNGLTFMVVPTISSLSTSSGIAGTSVTITGTGFGASQGTSSVLFNGTSAATTNWSATSITTAVPSGATAGNGNVMVLVAGSLSNGEPFTVVPNIASLSPTTGVVGSQVAIEGTGFGASQGTSAVTFNGTAATTISNWSGTSIVAVVPTGATTGNLAVIVGGVASAGFNFTVNPVTTLNTSRYQHNATLLNNGIVLVAGGVSCPSGSSCAYLNSAELYNPASGMSTNTGSLATARSAPAVLLPNGNVLIAGGASCASGTCTSLSSAEIYNPASGTFTSGGNMNVPRDGQTMTLLADGTVLIAGGETCTRQSGGSSNYPTGRPLHHEARLIEANFSPVIGSGISCSAQNSAEIYDPVAGTFTFTSGSLNVARYNAAAVRLVNGQVLIAGGSSEYYALSAAEIYDPSAGTFTQTTGSLQTARTLPTATLLNNGLVLIAGGSTCDPLTCPTNTAELYDDATNAFQSTAGAMNVARVGQTATLLTNGQVFLAGGNSNCQTYPCTTESSTEIYNPTASTFSLSQSMTTARTGHTATLLSNGSVLLAGGFASGATLSSIEPYQPSSFVPSGLVSIAVTPGSSSIGVGDAGQFTATGTFSNGSTQTLQSVVWTSANAAVASINNDISSSGFAFGLGVGSTTITATAGTISGSATLSIQLPSTSSVNPSSGTFGTQITISGTSFGSEQASGSVTIGGVAASILSWTNSSIVVSPASNANPGVGAVVVNTAEGTNSSSASFTVIPSIASFAPSLGPIGTTVTINGADFGSSGVVTFDGIAATILSWSPTSLTVVVPTGASAGIVIVTSNSQSSNTAVFTVLPTPSITGLSTLSGPVGTPITITGTNFGSSQGASTVVFNGTVATPTSWSANSIVVPVPAAATSGNVVITVSGVSSNGVNFTVVPTITSLSPTAGTVGTLLVIAGTGFGPNLLTGAVAFNGTAVTPISWSGSSIIAPVPPGATTGNVTVTVGGVSSNGVNFTVQAGGFVATTGQMAFARYAQTTTQLATGQVLVSGGINGSGVLSSAELYTPSTQTFAATAAMNVARWLHTATQLNDGTVLIAGGSDLANEETLDTAEIYSPATGTFSLLASTLNTARVGHTATLLDNGQVLIVGGYDPDYGLIADAELYDPPSQTFIDLGDTNSPRYGHTATILQSGQILIAGGETDAIPTGAFDTAELFNLANRTFTPAPTPMNASREGHTAVLLNNGQVLITGGDNPPNGTLSSAEIYDPPSNTFIPAPSAMTAPRISHTMTVLNGGKVLIAGGATDSNTGSVALNSAELYDPATQTFVPVGNMTSVREHQTATLLNDGTVLEDGGTDGTNVFASAEIYTSSRLNGLVSIAVSPSAPSLGTGAQQLFTAVGTFSDGSTQTLASILWSSSSVSAATVSDDATNPGVANGLAQGTTTISASATGVSGTATLTVTAPTLLSITLSPLDVTIPAGGTQQFTAIGVYSDGSTQDLTSTATWTSPSDVVIAINSTGLVAGLFQGTTTIQVNSGSVNASTTVMVAGAALVSIAVTPATATIAQGSSQQLQAIGTYSDGSTQNITAALAWTSGAPTVATVANTGIATGVSQGIATLTGTSQANQAISASATVTVTPPTLASITVSPNAASLSAGATQQLTVTGIYTDGSTQNLTGSSTWVSSNSTVVGVSSGGLVTAVATGNATITATSGSFSGTVVLVVTNGTTQANLTTSRYLHNATILNNGEILVAGGINCTSPGSCTYLSSAELYNPNSNAFSTAGSMMTARSAPSVLLQNGKVFTAGGYTCDSSGNCSSLISAEIYDPVAGTFSGAGSMTVARSGHTMTLLQNGMVLIAGGQNCTSGSSCTTLSSAEVYDPNAGTFTATTYAMNAARYGASAVLLNSGLVLIAGGFNGTNLPAVTELFNPAGNSFLSSTPILNVPVFDATAILLNNGQVLLAGGSTCSLPGCPTNAAEIYDPVAATFTLVAGGMTVPRFSHSANLLTNGQVFVAGGYSSCASTCTEEASDEIYDPVAGVFSVGQPFATAIAGHTGSLAANGNVLLIGGINAGVTLAGDEWYQPASLTPAGLVSITVAPASASLAVGQNQQFVATGTFTGGSTQTLQSVIWNSSNVSVTSVTNSPGNSGFVTALSAGATTLTATAGDIGGFASLSAATLVSLAISPANPSIAVGSGQQLRAYGTFSDNSVQDLTSSASWSSSNLSILSVLTASSGLPGFALGGSIGTATVTSTFQGLQATASITVQAAPAPPAAPSVTTVSPVAGSAGTQVTITGSGFGSTQGAGNVWIGTTFGSVVSWSNTQIVAIVAPISTSGVVQVQQNALSSNAVPFSVSTAAISSLSPTSGVPGTQVIISGSGFGATQGSGQIWLGTANGVVQSWSDTQVVALVAVGAMSGNAQILQNGVMSNAIPFSINTLHISNVTPNSGAPGTLVTINGSGFGSTQGDSTVWLGNMNGQVIGWSNNQVVAAVASNAVSGVVKIEQNGIWSNVLVFTVPEGFGGGGGGGTTSVILVPSVLTMLVGQTHSIQAINSSGASVTGLTWTSSNASVVTLSSSDPPVLTAVGPGNATITAGNGSADVTVLSGNTYPVGAVLWSNPGDATGVTQIVPAVPSPSGAADVFALQGDCMVQALASDGTVAWVVNIGTYANSCNSFIPDFQGGIVVYNPQSINEVNGAGVVNPAFTVTNPNDTMSTPVVHTDGTIFTLYTNNSANTLSVVGVDPATGYQLFSDALDQSTSNVTYSFQPFGSSGSQMTNSMPTVYGNLMIAGDGYAYVSYEYTNYTESDFTTTTCYEYSGVLPVCDTGQYTSSTGTHLMLMRVGTNGSSSKIDALDWAGTTNNNYQSSDQYYFAAQDFMTGAVPALTVSQPITNGTSGVLLGWEADTTAYCGALIVLNETYGGDSTVCNNQVAAASTFGLIVTSGTSAASPTVNIPGQASPIAPALQLQDGTFAGTVGIGPQPGMVTQTNMIAFNSSGGTNWSVPNDSPKIATSEGGVIGTSGAIYDNNGNVTGQMASMPTYSWKGAYVMGSVTDLFAPWPDMATTLESILGGNFTGNGTSLASHTFGLAWCGTGVGEVPCSFGANLTWDFCPNLAGGCSPDKSFAGDYPDWVTEIKVTAFDDYEQAFLHYPIVIQQGSKGAEFTAYVTGDKITSGDLYIMFSNPGQARLYYYGDMIDAQTAIGFSCGPSTPCLSYPPSNPTAFDNFLTLINAIGAGIGNGGGHEASHYMATLKNQTGYGLPIVDCGAGNESAGAVACYNNYNFVYEFFSATGYPQDPTNPDSTGGSFFYVNIPGYPIRQELRDDCWIQQWTVPNQKSYSSGGTPCP